MNTTRASGSLLETYWSLQAIRQNLDPESAESEAIDARLAALTTLDKATHRPSAPKKSHNKDDLAVIFKDLKESDISDGPAQLGASFAAYQKNLDALNARSAALRAEIAASKIKAKAHKKAYQALQFKTYQPPTFKPYNSLNTFMTNTPQELVRNMRDIQSHLSPSSPTYYELQKRINTLS